MEKKDNLNILIIDISYSQICTDLQIYISSNQTENVLIPSRSCYFSEGELEAEWLQDVGLSTLISGDEEEDCKALLSTLTRTQAAAVKKRYNTYTQTMRKRNKQSVRDVRDIFGVSESPVSKEHGSKGLVWLGKKVKDGNMENVLSAGF